MKRKNTIWPIVGAVLAGVVCIVLFFKITKDQTDAANKRIADAQADSDRKIAELENEIKNAPQPTAAAPAAPKVDTRKVLYSTMVIEPGTRIGPNMYEAKDTPVNILPDAYVQESDVNQKFASRHIEPGDPFTPRVVSAQLPHLAPRISPGMRAVSIPVFNGDGNRTGNFVVDGDLVDIYYTHTAGLTGGNQQTDLILQKVKTIYIPNLAPTARAGTKDEGVNPAQPVSVTFEVTPEDAQSLILLETIPNSHFAMVLRPTKDEKVIRLGTLDVADVFDDMKSVEKKSQQSDARVKKLQDEIALESAQTLGNTNATPTPTP